MLEYRLLCPPVLWSSRSENRGFRGVHVDQCPLDNDEPCFLWFHDSRRNSYRIGTADTLSTLSALVWAQLLHRRIVLRPYHSFSGCVTVVGFEPDAFLGHNVLRFLWRRSTCPRSFLDAGTKHLRGMKIAVVGSGVSGIGAVWALNEYSDHQVHLFESNDYLGGHTHTVEFVPRNKGKADAMTNVDTGFIVQSFPWWE